MQRHIVRDFGTCLSFNGSTTKIVTSVWSTNINNISLSAWFKTNNYALTRQCIISNGSGSPGQNGYALVLSGSSTTDGSLYLLSHNSAWQSLNYKIQDYRWHHIVATIDNSNNLVVFIDGVQIFSGAVTTLFTPDTNSLIGTDTIGFFSGLIDECRIYTKALSATEVANLFYGINPDPATFIDQYKLDEGSGTTATDSVGSKNGTITAGTYSTDVFMKSRIAA